MFESEHPSEGKPPAFKGSMIIYTVSSADAAWELIQNDVYAKNGVWDLEKAQVIPVSHSIMILPMRRLTITVHVCCARRTAEAVVG